MTLWNCRSATQLRAVLEFNTPFTTAAFSVAPYGLASAHPPRDSRLLYSNDAQAILHGPPGAASHGSLNDCETDIEPDGI